MLDLRSLTYVIKLADRASYARAADDLGISQPALTRAIQALERKINLLLFNRDRSGVTTTPQGAEFVEQARILVANAGDLERRTALAAAGMAGHVRFGIAPMPARALLAQALIRQSKAAPELTFEVNVRNVAALWPQLVTGEIEFFLSAEGQVPQFPPVRTENLGRFPLGVIVNPKHPLLANEDAKRKFPLYVSSGTVVHIPASLQQHLCFPPNVVEDLETLSHITLATEAVWICSPFAVQSELSNGSLRELHMIPNQPIEMRIVMYSLDRRLQSPAARSLASIFRGLIREIP